jgi:nucleoid DNA-binding protein
MNKVSKSSDWKVKLKSKKKPRFKPGSELTDSVNIMNVEVIEDNDDQKESTSFQMNLEKESKEQLAISYKETTMPGANSGTESIDKVNVMEIELTDEVNDDSEISEVKMTTSSNQNASRSINVRRKSKPRFKPGADLTDKVNLVAVEVLEQVENDVEVCEITINITSKVSAWVETAAELN